MRKTTVTSAGIRRGFTLVLVVMSIVGVGNVCCVAQSIASNVGSPHDRRDAFERDVKPLLAEYCSECHNADEMESGVRVDHLTGAMRDRRLFLWKGMLKQLADGKMPPEDAAQPNEQQRTAVMNWIQAGLQIAVRRTQPKHGTIRRLTLEQYRNTLADLLDLKEDLTGVLPPDGISKEGFTNNGETLLVSPLMMESYFDIAERALDLCLVDESRVPIIQNFRMDLGAGLNRDPLAEKLILGANSHLLENTDFSVTQLTPIKPFHFEPFRMQTAYDFHEGYRGNSTVRGWRHYDSIYHAVFACMRGTRGYTKGQAYETIPTGLLLRPAIPSPELFGESSTYGPRANFKVSLRELPRSGDFRVKVRAARYEDALLLEPDVPASPSENRSKFVDFTDLSRATTMLDEAGVYQVDVEYRSEQENELLSLTLDGRHFSGRLKKSQNPSQKISAFMVARISDGPLRVQLQGRSQGIQRIHLSKLSDDDRLFQRFEVFERRTPLLGVHVGLRRDCGSTLSPVGTPQMVSSASFQDYEFLGAINNFPRPDVQPENDNYLAGVREIGVRSEYTDGRDLPRLLIQSVEFEGPYLETWPPRSHQQIFTESVQRSNVHAYAREIIGHFAERAFRRPLRANEEQALLRIWETSYAEGGAFQACVKDALLAVLTSPQFLYITEESRGPEAERLTEYELAAKLSYFLWNSPPDGELLTLAEAGKLAVSLDEQTERLIEHHRFERFTRQFVSQWLRLDRFEVLDVDRKRYPALTRDTRKELRKETVAFVQFLMRHNLPVENLIASDFILANDVVASYYGLGEKTESGLRFVPVFHEDDHLGGILSQASILAGLSDGREANPVKRGAWFARKIIAEPPDDPPPNVPELTEDNESLSLREKLELHRNQEGCYNCHARIDPWGLPFEAYDAGGRFRDGLGDTDSVLPDQTTVADLSELREYLVRERIDRVAFSFMSHLASYATGRQLTYQEVEFLEQEGRSLKSHEYRMRDMIRFVIQSKLFLEK